MSNSVVAKASPIIFTKNASDKARELIVDEDGKLVKKESGNV